MGYNEEKIQYETPFEGLAERQAPQFDKVPDVASRMEQGFAQYQRDLAPYEQSLRRNQKTDVANARIPYDEDAQFYKAAARFLRPH